MSFLHHMTFTEHIKFAIVPFKRGENPRVAIVKLNVISWAKEICDTVTMFPLQTGVCTVWLSKWVAVCRNDSVHSRLVSRSGQEPQRIADIDDGVVGFRLHIPPLITPGFGTKNLQAKLLAEKESQCPQVCVLVVPRSHVGILLLWVTKECQRASRNLILTMNVLESEAGVSLATVRQNTKNFSESKIHATNEAAEQLVMGLSKSGIILSRNLELKPRDLAN
jgi:hypothetical protein